MDGQETEPRWLADDEQKAWRSYLRGSRLLELVLDRDLQAAGVQLSEYEIVSMISEAPSRRLRMSSLAEQVVQSRSRLTHTAARLEKRGWVARESCLEDRRGVELVLTPEGAEAVQRIARQHVESVRVHLADALSPKQFLVLGEVMQLVADRIQAGSGEELCTEPGSIPGRDLSPDPISARVDASS